MRKPCRICGKPVALEIRGGHILRGDLHAACDLARFDALPDTFVIRAPALIKARVRRVK